jgi:hypothetical protein
MSGMPWTNSPDCGATGRSRQEDRGFAGRISGRVRYRLAKYQSIATSKSFFPCQESEGKSPPRCSAKLHKLSLNEIITHYDAMPAQLRLPDRAAKQLSSACVKAVTNGCEMPCITGRASVLRAILRAKRFTLRCEPKATPMAALFAGSPTAGSEFLCNAAPQIDLPQTAHRLTHGAPAP